MLYVTTDIYSGWSWKADVEDFLIQQKNFYITKTKVLRKVKGLTQKLHLLGLMEHQ